VTFGLIVVTIIPHLFLQGGEGALAYYSSLLRQFSPIPAMQQIVGQTSVGGLGLVDSTDYVTRYIWLSVAVTVAAGVVTAQRMNYSLIDRSRSQGVITDDRSRGQRAARRVFFLIDPQKRKAGIPWYLNPVMVKEFRSRQFGRLHWLLRLISACAVLSLLLTLATTMGTVDWGVERIGGIIIVAQAGLIILLTPGLTGGIIAGEIENGGWELLRTTPLRARRILRGKLISVALTLLLVLCATLPGYGVMMVIKPVLQEQVIQVLTSLVLTAAVSLCISAVVSSFFRTTASATTVSYGVLVALLVGTMLVWMNRGAPFSHSFVESALTVNPMAAALNAMQVEGFENYNLVPKAWWCAGILCGVLITVLHVQTWRLCRAD
jgi:ABC-type transport system involved in multi-copper enzyme maturation permease subunit